MSSKRLTLRGHVQGVGFREWMVGEARRLSISGWVRNRADGSVEALLDGPPAAVEELARLCRRGPPLAEVLSLTEDLTDPPSEQGFHRRADA